MASTLVCGERIEAGAGEIGRSLGRGEKIEKLSGFAWMGCTHRDTGCVTRDRLQRLRNLADELGTGPGSNSLTC